MGFNKCYIRCIEDLKEEFNKSGLESFVKRYHKYDSFTGSSESFKFLEQKIKEYENYKQTNITTNNNPNRM